MNGYSRIRQVNTARSKSMDLSDLSYIPRTSKSLKNYSTTSLDNRENQHGLPDKNNHIQGSTGEHANEDDDGERFGVILSRKFPVCSTSSQKFMSEKQSTSLQSALKSALSMRRSSSVSERYCKIHHQCDPSTDDETVMLTTLQTGSMKRKGKILKACKRLLGF